MRQAAKLISSNDDTSLQHIIEVINDTLRGKVSMTTVIVDTRVSRQ